MDNGIKLALGERVEQFETGGGVTVVTDKRAVTADIVILAVGVANSELAKACGLESARAAASWWTSISKRRTKHYAVGDAVRRRIS